MLDASHAVIGASLAKLVPNPVLGLPLALGLHFVGDLVPHWDLRTRHVKRSKLTTIALSLTDAGIGYALGWWLFNQTVPWPYLALMMFISQLPDWIEAPYHIFDWKFPPFSSIKHLQSRLHRKLDLPWGLIWQGLIVLLFIVISL
ncbi:MAG: hypothetical protein Q8P47_02940 [Candidatus Beckwithbacteria bacterium]|nr:hypothetical protein [Candidatus Beckwithbacteria bacterium]